MQPSRASGSISAANRQRMRAHKRYNNRWPCRAEPFRMDDIGHAAAFQNPTPAAVEDGRSGLRMIKLHSVRPRWDRGESCCCPVGTELEVRGTFSAGSPVSRSGAA